MLTDDDLLRELSAAMRDETAHLRYAGRVPAPRRSLAAPLTAVPVAAAAAAVLVLPQLDGGTRSAAPAVPVTSPSASAAPTGTPTAPALVTDTLELAGMTLSYRHAEGTPSPAELLFLGVRPPADARAVDLTGAPDTGWLVKAWVGTSPEIGKEGLFVQTRDEGIGQYSFFTADGVSADDWEQMITTGSN
ncbi:hypothetical protein G5V58_21650 [Nocardioides anomalus]|uniref:Uncharacterized protein n=1 Tax=Nocardioides anomalus TaxID=2712223 RepID=A0A6G6WI71_9ACTN|nr:hypothetical protein [Nocardioides anomalus]QIG45028.1 hypothetical protein G5V58_21650 [Nocardioides anomalus]